ncbi:MAG: hypothetical protein QM482_01310 [Sulfurospirillum sp.]
MKKYLNSKNSIKISIFITSFVLSIVVLFNLFSNPLDSSKSVSYLLLLILFAICVNLGLGILKSFIDFSQNRWVFYTIQWILTFLVPVTLIVLIEHPLQKKIMADVSKSMEPTLNYIKNYKKNSAVLPVNIQATKEIKLKYYRKGKFYMLATEIYPSKTDKETIYFNSKDNKWYRFHNDQYEYYKDKKIVPPNLKNFIWFTDGR